MNYPILSASQTSFPPQLLEIPDVPAVLYYRGQPLDRQARYLCIVGARAHSPYGQHVCQSLIEGLAGTDITIVSGLALGIDSIAHRTALSVGLHTVAFPGSGLDEGVLYPAANMSLAQEILTAGGTLISEFSPTTRAAPWSFPRRNRLMAGICHALLVIEAGHRSGTLITARLALDYNRDVLAVPGPITSETSAGAHSLLKHGATLVTSSNDIRTALGLPQAPSSPSQETLSAEEHALLSLLHRPCSRDELIRTSGKSVSEMAILLAGLEIKGIIKEAYGEIIRI